MAENTITDVPTQDSSLVIFIVTVLQESADRLIDRWMCALIRKTVSRITALSFFVRTLFFVPVRPRFSENGMSMWLFAESGLASELTITRADAECAGMAKTMARLSRQKFSADYISQLSLYVDASRLVQWMLACLIRLSDDEKRLSHFILIEVVLNRLDLEFLGVGGAEAKISETRAIIKDVYLESSKPVAEQHNTDTS